ncbi:ATP-dependent RNA helicase-like protein DB10 [Amaranthus tricolor]|uniref:ATP-dependent RNA helicase-like protein DB10 n=1 Tax=Amaranthus tricolor TaxID=29722 RepID=UPI00258AC1C4|nr:ATP-dependent RNA helicase-like protein DB10 [Amaranthus tricolor]
MAATATASAIPGPRYAPEDPSLPKPWRGLVDGKTGYLYFWNPETNVTQYERPASSSHSHASSISSRPSSSYVSSSAQLQQSFNVPKDSDGDDSRGSNGNRSQQSARCGNPPSEALGSTREDGPVDAGSTLSPEAYRRRHEISVSGSSVPSPFTTFEATGFPSEILKEAQQAGFSAPTPIQAQSWPIAMQGRDIVAIAKTGSGKTLGYLLPGFMHLKRCQNNSRMGPTVLVLSPTRELATQIQDEAVKFGRSSRISCTCLYGGAPKGPQLKELDRGADIVVATPGRLNDILESRRVSLNQVSYLVLDEADRMLDMGFEPQIRKIVTEVPTRRQTLMYTATWPKEVRKIAADLLSNPVQVNIGNSDILVANKSITQHVEVLPYNEKQRRLEQILRSQEPGSRIIIFCATKKMCDQLARNLSRPYGATAIHGDKSQGERDHVLNQFRTGKSPVLVATDVAARGLDVKDVRVVVNYDFPTGIEDYVHRIGRTGRAGATGEAYTFLNDQDSKHASDLVKILEGANQKIPQEVRDMALRGGSMGKARRWGPSPGARDGGRGGRSESNYGGRDGGRSHERYDRGYNDSYNGDTRGKYDGGYQSKSFGGDGNRGGSRSPSPSGQRAWGGNQVRGRSRSRSRSRSPDRSNQGPPVRSFHQMMMERPRSSPSKLLDKSSAAEFDKSLSEWGKSSAITEKEV